MTHQALGAKRICFFLQASDPSSAVFTSISVTFTWDLDIRVVGLGGLGVTCSPRDPRFAGSNLAEVDVFFQDVKNPEHKSSGRDFKLGVPESEISL